MSIKEILKKKIKESLSNLNIDYNEEITIEIPKNKANGDYSTNIALILTKQLHQNPNDIANNIKENINSDVIEQINILNGFINIFIKKVFLFTKLNEILDKKNDYGKNILKSPSKINIEFVSANPTGILHMGHGRGATYGDNLARILSFIGYDVTKEYYINDAGNQMNNLAISIKERYKEKCHQPFEIPENGYHGKEIITIAEKIYNIYNDSKLNESNEFFKQEGLSILLDQIKKDLDLYRVNFDVFTSEQYLYDEGIVDKTLNMLKNSGKCYINEGALWLKTTEYGDDKDRVLIKSDGAYTYCLPDIAYHSYKFQRGYDNLITVLGADHHGSTARVKAGLQILKYDVTKLDYKLLQMVRIIKDGEELKLSKRTGKTLTLTDLIDEVGINAVRYFFSSKSLDSQIDFNIDLAKEQSTNNPIYYVEYANARICSILKKHPNNDYKINNYSTMNDENTYNILNKLFEFEDVVLIAGEKKLPHLVTNYVYELAAIFHSYYSSYKFITEDEIYTKERIALLIAIKIVLNNALNLIGIIPREEM